MVYFQSITVNIRSTSVNRRVVLMCSFQSSPLSYASEQRAFLRCHLSPISCKRSLSTVARNENLIATSDSNDVRQCLRLGKSLWLCLEQQAGYSSADIDHVD
jgi:hypothetical protein